MEELKAFLEEGAIFRKIYRLWIGIFGYHSISYEVSSEVYIPVQKYFESLILHLSAEQVHLSGILNSEDVALMIAVYKLGIQVQKTIVRK